MQLSHVSARLSSFVFFILFTSIVARPSGSLYDNSSFNLGTTGNVAEVLTPSSAETTSVPFSYRDVKFEFTRFGIQIPKREVQNLLTSADKAIDDDVDEHPSDSIANGRFEFRAPNGRTLISIRSLSRRTITWAQLFQILQGLYQFMVGSRSQQDHCRILDFSIRIPEEGAAGFGVIWFFSSGVRQSLEGEGTAPIAYLAKRAQLALPGLANLSLPTRPGEDTIKWRIPGTTITLDFYFLGMPVPQDELIATLQGATESMKDHLVEPTEDIGIENGTFDWRLPTWHDGSKMGLTVFSYWNVDVTWRQLYDILRGLYMFTVTLEPNQCQTLGFKIRDLHEGTLGVGSLWHYSRWTTAVDRRAKRGIQSSLQVGNESSPSGPAKIPGIPVIWPVPDTSVWLLFDYLGSGIPTHKIKGLLREAEVTIDDLTFKEPTRAILNDRFHFESLDGDVVLNIVIATSDGITWQSLGHVLVGLVSFCAQNHNQVLVFDIEISEKNVGFGTILHRGQYKPLENRSLNTTATLPNSNVGAPPVHFPIPGTSDSLLFTSFGQPIPEEKVRDALRGALNVIAGFVHSMPFKRIPNNRYRYNGNQGVSIVISLSTFSEMSWVELDEVLAGLAMFMTGINPPPGQELQPHNQALGFNIYLRQPGYVGTGVVTYQSPPQITTGKRDIIASQRHGREVDLAVQNLTQYLLDRPNFSHLVRNVRLSMEPRPEPLRFPIVQSPITLLLADFGFNRIPRPRVEELFEGIFFQLNASVIKHPNETITNPWFYELDYPRRKGKISIIIYTQPNKSLSWKMLDQLLKGLDVFMVSQSAILTFVIDSLDRGRLGSGAVQYKPATLIVEDKALKKRAPASVSPSQMQLQNGTQSPRLDLVTFIPYHVLDTPITLQITLNGRGAFPQIYAGATLSSCIGLIRTRESYSDRIPHNTSSYHNRMSGVGITFMGYNDQYWLTWKQLTWVLMGLERFMTQSADHCKTLTAEVDVGHTGESSATRYGAVTLWYQDPNPSGADEQ